MTTRFLLIFETDPPDIEIEEFQKILPPTFLVVEEDGKIYILVETTKEDDKSSQYLVERELDRYFFLTCIKIKAELVRKRIVKVFTSSYRIHGDWPSDKGPQKWNYDLPIQLKLWSMAIDSNDFRLQTLYYFHIIELAYPDTRDRTHYPDYLDPTTTPAPLTECKFLRHLIAHAGEVGGQQLKNYCAYLNIPELMFDATDNRYKQILINKVKLLEQEAKNAINNML